MNVKHEELTVRALYDLSYTAARPLLEACTYPWEALPKIGEFIKALGKTLSPEEYEQRGEDVWVAKSAKLYPNVYIAGPTIIGPETEVRPGAFIRGNALIGAGCVVGNSTEVKNAILFDGAQAPHYNYIGDSVMGHKAHTGAGAVTSNLKQDHSNVTVLKDGERVETGMRKFGAMLGDHAEIGCGSVLNPARSSAKTHASIRFPWCAASCPRTTSIKRPVRSPKFTTDLRRKEKRSLWSF